MLSDAAKELLSPSGLGAVGMFAAVVWFTAEHWSRSVPSVRVGYFGLRNQSEYAKDPAGFLLWCTGRYSCVFKFPSIIFKTKYWMLCKKLNKEYLDMREDVWSFGDAMVSAELCVI
jgi:hypothetical protein